MSFGKYVSEISGLANQILEEFSEQDKDTIYSELKSIGMQGWWEWKQENHNLIMQYVSATPSQREKGKKYKLAMPLLAYASYQHYLAGYYFIHKAESMERFIGGSYRDVDATAGDLFQETINYYKYEHEDWPWGGDNPFIKDT
jgi:hypothetical protein